MTKNNDISEKAKFRELLAKSTLYNGKYCIEKVLGMGGFGITYYAKHATLQKYYAIKEFFINGFCVRNTYTKKIHLQGITEEDYSKYKQKFIEEAQTLAKLEHPNIVKVIDVFEENGTSYIVMPFVEGITLQQFVEQKGKLDYEIAVNYIAQISEAIGYVHEHSLLHRDITPDNVIITPENNVILIDFGSAREFIHDKTQSHTAILKKGYAPMEQYSAISKKGAYSDIYSLGAVFYFALTGQKPMDATERTMTENMPGPKTLQPSIPNDANRTIMKAMALKPKDRFQNVDELMYELTGRKDWRSPIVVEKEKKSKGRIIGIIIALAVIIGAIIYSIGIIGFTRGNKSDKNAELQNEMQKLLNRRVENLRVCLYDGKIYLRPTQGILDTTIWYTPINDSLLETVASLPDNLELLFKKDSIPPRCSYYLYTGRMEKGYPDHNRGKAIYDCGAPQKKSIYEGGFQKGLKHGGPDCKRTFDDGRTFVGSYENDLPTFGTLKMNDKDSTVYRGTWKDENPYNGEVRKNDKLIAKYINGERK